MAQKSEFKKYFHLLDGKSLENQFKVVNLSLKRQSIDWKPLMSDQEFLEDKAEI